MSNTIRIKRRATGLGGAPSTLKNAELAFNEVDNVLYYGTGTDVNGDANTIISIGGDGAFVNLSGNQTVSGAKTFSGTVALGSSATASTKTSNDNSTSVATTAYVDAAVAGATVSSEQVQDIVGAQFASNGSHTGISATYDDAGDGAVDLSLTVSGVTSGSYGNSSNVSSITVDTYGRVTSASNTAISIQSTAVTDFTEAAQDAAASLLTSGSHSGIAATYDDANAKIDLNVSDFTITLGGDLSGSVTITDLASATLNATIAADSVALGTDTTGDYVQSVTAGTGVTVTGGTGEGSTPSIAIGQAIATSDSPTFAGLTTTSDLSVGGNTTITGNLTVNGTTTTVNSTTLTVDDKNIELGATASPSDASADGGGITLKGATDKTFNWVDATDSWTSSEHLNIASGKQYYINGTSVLSSDTLGSGIINSSLTSLGTITSGTWNATAVGLSYGGTGATTASQARTNLGLAIGTDVQAYDAELAALAGITSSANALPYFTGSGTASTTTLTSYARTLLDDSDAGTMRSTLGLGTMAVQAASNVAITGGTIDNITFNGGTF